MIAFAKKRSPCRLRQSRDKKEKSPVAHRAFPVLSPVKASCAKKSLTTANGQRGKTEAPHISRDGLPSRCGKKSHPRGLERDGLGHQISAAMTSPRHRLVPPHMEPKKPRPPATGAFSYPQTMPDLNVAIAGPWSACKQPAASFRVAAAVGLLSLEG
jgi:hypothetical protein